MPDATELVDAIGAAGGRYDGHRAAHAKGILLTGTFTATPEAATLTTAAHMSGEPVKVTARFSNGSAKPEGHDAGIGDGRGLAVKFYLPGGGTTDLVMLSLPVFFVRDPQEFLEFTLARAESNEKMFEWIGAHPDTMEAVQQIAPRLVPPRSYATLTYNSIHAFALVDRDGNRRWIRWRWVPDAGEEDLPEGEREGIDRNYLQQDILGRLPVRFTLVARLAEDGDPLEDPTKAWPEEREQVTMGVLELTGPDTEREQGDDVLVFDPMRVTDGIEPSDDPILHIRSHAYSVSVERRSGIPRPA